MKRPKGFTLVTVIIIVILIATVLGGMLPLIGANLSFSNMHICETQALYSAQGGVMDGIYNLRRNGNYIGKSALFPENNVGYIYGQKQYNFLLLDPSASQLANANMDITGWTIKNVNSNNAITITDITINWTPNNANERITRIKLNNANKWNSSKPSGTKLDIANTLINKNTTIFNNIFRFNVDMRIKTVSVIFHLSDGSFFESLLSPPASQKLTMKATGRVGPAGQYKKRTLEVDYEPPTAKITRWEEVYEHY
jgi:type II secretory pathway pseudopilin PulG